MSRVRSRRIKTRTGLDLTPEQEYAARRALGQGPPGRARVKTASAFPSKAALRAAMAEIEAYDADHGLDGLRAEVALRVPDPIERIASIQEMRERRRA